MIVHLLTLSARDGIPGRTFFVVQDVPKAEWGADDYRMKLRDADARDRFRTMMARENRILEGRSVRRQYLIPAARRIIPGTMVASGLRTIEEGESPDVITHYRVVWFAETGLI